MEVKEPQDPDKYFRILGASYCDLLQHNKVELDIY